MKSRKRQLARLSGSRAGHSDTGAFEAASEAWDSGQLRPAFRLFSIAARNGDRGAQLNLGLFYQNGIGVRANNALAMVWYRRAYRKGDASAANNIGLMFLGRGDTRRARAWLERAVKAGNDDSRLHLAEISIANGRKTEAISHLTKLKDSRTATRESTRLAREKLRRLKHAL